MCTVGLILQQHPTYPLIVAANRDESADRPATHPLRWSNAPIPFVGGRDEVAGGTWMGFSDAGVMVALTNLWVGDFRKKRPLSRGAVVSDLLASTDLDDAASCLAAINTTDRGPFNLICADATGRAFTACSDEGLIPRWLTPGYHAISNLTPGTPWTKTDRVIADLSNWHTSDDLTAHLTTVLATHIGLRDPQHSVCVHTPTSYGTVSSTLLLTGGTAPSILRHCDGPPCRTPMTDYSALLPRA
ncbi:MAG: hypothetical protein ACI8RZ_001524 [Myxococcota bacterium]|jgi:uncharacterized protein with NRDE domain